LIGRKNRLDLNVGILLSHGSRIRGTEKILEIFFQESRWVLHFERENPPEKDNRKEDAAYLRGQRIASGGFIPRLPSLLRVGGNKEGKKEL